MKKLLKLTFNKDQPHLVLTFFIITIYCVNPLIFCKFSVNWNHKLKKK
ncbi:hypothetical protein HMPREF0519_0213 [Lentilactobacillus hilgardii DSM 20176 = ATCC 8290]|uniref:Uncharacterized protein n=1 Tax=Lentilactobacillus hilgardii (strain ATCC 8290 / DSM 20176 / CCUG 30140 / JCM 1155 / KCTC 3500 / NBRC 15886 / NCIMB 8040 / NRRL B-1843 / 9) TaxID=1423757 RepID=C0XG52_LENH9|nr:hypothetical protein HMPREF0519_0213 [Lentilactobacillus hilgardii DSM 20176 = ATCC 8290]